MSELYLMTTISDRNQIRRFLLFYKEYGVSVVLTALGRGTASSEMLDYFGLEASEKAVLFSVVTDTVWKKVKSGLEKNLRIDIPGMGIVFTVPLSSIGGKKQLEFLTDGQEFVKGEESELMVIANQGYTEVIMDAAREAGASGGTAIHAKGTGMERAERFLGVSIAAEKEIIFIVAKSAEKNAIMKSIMEQAGMASKAKAIVFSVPVTDTAGMRLIEALEEEDNA